MTTGQPTPTKIYAESDDLIEIEGEIDDEFSDPAFGGPDGAYVYLSTGDVIRFRLEDEGWRAQLVVDATSPAVAHLDGEDDEVVVAARVDWVVATTTRPARRDPR